MHLAFSRRDFLGLMATTAAIQGFPPTLAGEETAARIKPLWIDPSQLKLPPRPWRKIHLDYHNSQHIPSVGEKFDPKEFGDRLVAGQVNGVVVFAKDMHGYFYYPSQYGPVHPGLKRDLLGEQVQAGLCPGSNLQPSADHG
jgi:hypothetical protein